MKHRKKGQHHLTSPHHTPKAMKASVRMFQKAVALALQAARSCQGAKGNIPSLPAGFGREGTRSRCSDLFSSSTEIPQVW